MAKISGSFNYGRALSLFRHTVCSNRFSQISFIVQWTNALVHGLSKNTTVLLYRLRSADAATAVWQMYNESVRHAISFKIWPPAEWLSISSLSKYNMNLYGDGIILFLLLLPHLCIHSPHTPVAIALPVRAARRSRVEWIYYNTFIPMEWNKERKRERERREKISIKFWIRLIFQENDSI